MRVLGVEATDMTGRPAERRSVSRLGSSWAWEDVKTGHGILGGREHLPLS